VYEGEGDGGGNGAGTGAGNQGQGQGQGQGSGQGQGQGQGQGGNPPGKEEGKGNGLLTQDQFNKALADEKRKWQGSQKELVAQLESLKQAQGLTQQQRDDLQHQIEALQATYTTKEEQAKQEREKLEKGWKKERDQLSNERDQWKNDYSKLYIDIDIRRAASKNNAFSEDQMVDYLGPRAKLAPEVGEDGKTTGKYVPVISFQDTDKDGKSITLELSIADAIKRMKELPDRFGNFFKVEGPGGIGSISRPGAGSNGGGFRPDMTPEEYREFRKKRGRGPASVTSNT
jgi:hypothetical protein